MKRIALVVAIIMIFAIFAGCAKTNEQEDTNTNGQEPANTNEQEDSESEAGGMHYAFEFTDVDGNVHKLSDYEGKPVYLEIWGSWCSVCMSGLSDMNDFAGEDHDYYVLSVVFPGHAGEKEQDDFITWFNDLGYNNLTVMFDNDLQVIKDFGINGFPTNIFFDAQGNIAGGQVGEMSPATIDQTMMKLVEKE